jgi:hypothetical protein
LTRLPVERKPGSIMGGEWLPAENVAAGYP